MTPTSMATSEVLEVDNSTSSPPSAARANHSLRRGGSSRAAARAITAANASNAPSPFFSTNRPSQAPGNSTCIRP